MPYPYWKLEIMWAKHMLEIGLPKQAERCLTNALNVLKEAGADLDDRLKIATAIDRVRAC